MPIRYKMLEMHLRPETVMTLHPCIHQWMCVLGSILELLSPVLEAIPELIRVIVDAGRQGSKEYTEKNGAQVHTSMDVRLGLHSFLCIPWILVARHRQSLGSTQE
jgi:hypothetical protein